MDPALPPWWLTPALQHAPLRGPAAHGVAAAPNGDGLAAHYQGLLEGTEMSDTWREAAALFVVAENDLEAEEFEESLRGASDALAGFRGAGDVTAAGDALRLMIHGFRYTSKRRFAEEIAREELENFEKDGNLEAQAKMKLSLGEICMDKKNNPFRRDALDYVTAALQDFRRMDDKKMMGLALLTLASLHLRSRLGDRKRTLHSAQNSAEEAFLLFEEVGYKLGSAKAMLTLAAVNVGHEEMEDAYDCARRALELFRKSTDRRLEALTLQCMAVWKLTEEQLDDAEPLAAEAVDIFSDLQTNLPWEAPALSVAVRIAGAVGNVASAVQMARRAWRAYANTGDQELEMIAVDMMVYAHLMNGNPEAAWKIMEKAVRPFNEAGTCEAEAQMLLWVAMLRSEGNLHGQAAKAFQAALEFWREGGDSYGQAHAMLWIADLRKDRKEYDGSLQAAEEAQAFFREAGDLRGEGEALLTVASVMLYDGNLDRAWSRATEAISFFKDVNDTHAFAKALTVLCEIQDRREEHMAALNTARRVVTLLEYTSNRRASAQGLLLISRMGLKVLCSSTGEMDPQTEEEVKSEVLQAVGEVTTIASCLNDGPLVAAAAMECGKALLADNRPGEAMPEIDYALILFEELGHKSSLASLFETRAKAFLALDKKTDAMKAAIKAREIFEELGDTAAVARMDEIAPRVVAPKGAIADGLAEDEATKAAALAMVRSEEDQEAIEKKAPREARAKKYSGNVDLSGELSMEIIVSRFHQIMDENMGLEDLEDDTPLMTAGLTSGNAIMLQRILAHDFPNVELPPTLAFDYPNISSISEFIFEKVAKKSAG